MPSRRVSTTIGLHCPQTWVESRHRSRLMRVFIGVLSFSGPSRNRAERRAALPLAQPTDIDEQGVAEPLLSRRNEREVHADALIAHADRQIGFVLRARPCIASRTGRTGPDRDARRIPESDRCWERPADIRSVSLGTEEAMKVARLSAVCGNGLLVQVIVKPPAMISTGRLRRGLDDQARVESAAIGGLVKRRGDALQLGLATARCPESSSEAERRKGAHADVHRLFSFHEFVCPALACCWRSCASSAVMICGVFAGYDRLGLLLERLVEWLGRPPEHQLGLELVEERHQDALALPVERVEQAEAHCRSASAFRIIISDSDRRAPPAGSAFGRPCAAPAAASRTYRRAVVLRHKPSVAGRCSRDTFAARRRPHP